MKQTPFHDVGLEHGAQMVELFGYYLPWEYDPGHSEEHAATRTRASLCDLDYMGEFIIEGRDALRLIQQLATNDYTDRDVGAIRYTAMCDAEGNMIDDGTIWHLSADRWMVVSGDEEDFAWIERVAESFDVQVSNITAQHTTLALQGPRSADVLGKLTKTDLSAIRYYHFESAKVANVECLLARMGYTGESGFELHFPPAEGRHMWAEIMAAGAEVGVVPLGQAALESLRQEAGYLLVGNDHDKSTNPLEAGIGFVVRFDKETFNGKEALATIARAGVKRRLVWFDLPSGHVASKGDSISFMENRIGDITSGSFSPTRGRGTAMGYVAPQHAIPGLSCSVDGESARMAVMPLYDPGDTLTRG